MKKMIVTGNVGRDPELRADSTGNQFVTFSIGVSVGTKLNPKTDWVEISCGGRLVEVARNYIKKGSKLLIEGFPTANAYINRENKAVASLRVSANNIEFLSKREDNPESDDSAYNDSAVHTLPEAQSTGEPVLESDEIPF